MATTALDCDHSREDCSSVRAKDHACWVQLIRADYLEFPFDRHAQNLIGAVIVEGAAGGQFQEEIGGAAHVVQRFAGIKRHRSTSDAR